MTTTVHNHTTPATLHQLMDTWIQGGPPFDAAPFMHTDPALDLFDPEFDRQSPFFRRRIFAKTFGFCMPGPTFVEQVGRFGPVVEIAAGSGYLSALLRAHGVDSIATDPYYGRNRYLFEERAEWPVHALTAEDAIRAHPERAVLCSWPCYDRPWAGAAIAHMQPGQVLLLIGESSGGCTGDDGLFARLNAGFTNLTTADDRTAVVSWEGVHDRLTVWRKHP